MTVDPRTLDVRPILKAGGEPFGEIMQAVASLERQQSLRLLASFKPVPLFAVMQQKGYRHEAQSLDGGDWEVVFTPAEQADAGWCPFKPLPSKPRATAGRRRGAPSIPAD